MKVVGFDLFKERNCRFDFCWWLLSVNRNTSHPCTPSLQSTRQTIEISRFFQAHCLIRDSQIFVDRHQNIPPGTGRVDRQGGLYSVLQKRLSCFFRSCDCGRVTQTINKSLTVNALGGLLYQIVNTNAGDEHNHFDISSQDSIGKFSRFLIDGRTGFKFKFNRITALISDGRHQRFGTRKVIIGNYRQPKIVKCSFHAAHARLWEPIVECPNNKVDSSSKDSKSVTISN